MRERALYVGYKQGSFLCKSLFLKRPGGNRIPYPNNTITFILKPGQRHSTCLYDLHLNRYHGKHQAKRQ